MKKLSDRLKAVLPQPVRCEAEIESGHGTSFMRYPNMEEAEKATDGLRKAGSRVAFFNIYSIFGKEYKRKAF